jgi:hypothetical protein
MRTVGSLGFWGGLPQEGFLSTVKIIFHFGFGIAIFCMSCRSTCTAPRMRDLCTCSTRPLQCPVGRCVTQPYVFHNYGSVCFKLERVAPFIYGSGGGMLSRGLPNDVPTDGAHGARLFTDQLGPCAHFFFFMLPNANAAAPS